MNKRRQEKQIGGDVMMKIFIQLPVKSILRFKCVSKAWCNWITDPYFIKLHFRRTIQDDNTNLRVILRDSCSGHVYSLNLIDPASSSSSLSSPSLIELNDVTPWQPCNFHDTTLGSCNGLILLHVTTDSCFHDQVALWNPTTGELNVLPSPVRMGERLSDYNGVVYGLGHDSNNDDYKVIAIRLRPSSTNQKEEFQVLVYSLRSNAWRWIGPIGEGVKKYRSRGTYLNGAVHWLSYDLKKILCFNCESEKWDEIEVPGKFRGIGSQFGIARGSHMLDLFGRRGRLCIACDKSGTSYGRTTWIEIYEMQEYGVKESWCRISIISNKIWVCRFGCGIKDGNFLLLRNHEEQQLILVNPTKDTAMKFRLDDINIKRKNQFFQPYPYFCESYITSLVSLKPSFYQGRV